ncbi:hypothetical protein Aph01nite_10430 [Acrocarpospora phusangensis]|uniref:ClpX-type ZB domain-containing protein n=1 Tax=Acrocarpospora phusangensis TaxID=1070424 RepID=A0A919Q6C2_9ACTN|nr:ClpX C4-type zinc finger protein [Acrocarpospora phusangensis]GIH22733.1 hypothetical protein Aph01nite_10430 [Acrocarpospora phusangensis]
MALDEDLLRQAREAGAGWVEAQERAEQAKIAYHRAIRRLHLAGASFREIADALELSHQRVHQIIESTGGTASWKPRKKGPEPVCTFCGAGKGEVNRLIAGPGVFICDACVVLASLVVSTGQSQPHIDLVPTASALTCTFCGKADGRIAAGPGVRICDQCLRICREVVDAT